MPTFTIFGDSLMKGVALDAARGKYIQLKNCFVNLFSDANKYDVNNYASFGCTITKGLSIVDRHLDKIPESDYVIVEFGGNDCNYDWEKVAAAPEADHQPVTPIDRFQEEYMTLIDKILKRGKTPFLLNLPPLDAGLFFRWIGRGLNMNNILAWLGDEDRTRRWHSAYSKAVEMVAAIRDVPLVDIRTPFESLTEYRSYLCEDGMHPNEKGHALISETVSSYRATYLQRSGAF